MAALAPDIEIAQEAKLKPITEIAAAAGIREESLELYGKYKAKVSLDLVKSARSKPRASSSIPRRLPRLRRAKARPARR